MIFAGMMYIVQQFRDDEFWQSEALAAFSIIIFLQRIPPWQNNMFASLKLTLLATRKTERTKKTKNVVKTVEKQKTTAYPSLLISH